MKFLVDANVLCEPTKTQRAQTAVDWFQANVLDCVSDAVVMGEIWRGIDRFPAGSKRTNLEAWFTGLRTVSIVWTGRSMLLWRGEV